MTIDSHPQSELAKLEFLKESSRALNSTLDIEQLPGVIAKIIRKATRAEVVSLLLVDDDKKHLVFELARGRRDEAVKGLSIDIGEGIAGWVARAKKPLMLDDATSDKRYSLSLEKKLGVKPRSIIAVPLILRGRLIGVVEAVNRRGRDTFSASDLDLAIALAETIATAVSNARIYRQAERRGLEYAMLAQITADIGKSLGLDEVLDRILANLERLIPFDAAAIFLFDKEHGRLVSVLQTGYSRTAAEKIDIKADEGLVGLTLHRKAGFIADDVREHEQYVAVRGSTRSEMVAPMIARGRVIGAFNVESDRVRAYGEHDLHLLEAFAAQAAVSVERAQLYEDQRVKHEIEDELRVARTVQAFFAPKRTLAVGHYQVAGNNRPSLEVSGDYHDYFPLRDGLIAFAIADVAGKGVPASIIMSGFRATLHTVANYLTSARQIALRANQILLETVRPEDFVTAFIGVLDPASGMVTYANAGHNPPILMTPDGRYRLLETGGPILGVFEDIPMQEGRFRLTDEVLLCYTDGATEIRNGDDEEYGEARLVGALREARSRSAYQVTRYLYSDLRRFFKGARQTDDVTYLVLRSRAC